MSETGGDRSTGSTAPVPDVVGVLGLTGVADLLRDWGRGLLEQLLPGPLEADAIASTPSARFSAESLQALAPGWTPPSETPFTERVLDEGADVATLARDRSLSPALWRMATERAWNDPGFQHEVARSFRAHLRAREPFAGSGAPASLAPATLWLLLEGIAVPALGPDAEALRPIARAHYECEGWAGFWDQWLVAHALEIEAMPLSPMPPRLATLLRELPLLHDPRYRECRGRLQDRTRGQAAALSLGIPEEEIERPMWYRSTRRAARESATPAPTPTPTRSPDASGDGPGEKEPHV